MHTVFLIMEGPNYGKLVREHCNWLEAQGIAPDWEVDGTPHYGRWGISFYFEHKNDAMLFRLVWA